MKITKQIVKLIGAKFKNRFSSSSEENPSNQLLELALPALLPGHNKIGFGMEGDILMNCYFTSVQ